MERDQKMSKKSAGTFISGLLLGSAIGTVTGLLIARALAGIRGNF
jgi:gas vesicle protein